MGFNLQSVGFVGLLGAGSTPPAAGPDYTHYAAWASGAQAGAFVPAISGAVSVALWVRSPVSISGFMIDLRLNGSGYFYDSGFGGTGAVIFVNGQAAANSSSAFSGFADNAWHRVYLEFATLAAGFHFLSRYTNEQTLQSAIQFAALTVYSRVFTLAEKQATAGNLPTDAILARYNGTSAAGQLLDVSGFGHAANLVGPMSPAYT